MRSHQIARNEYLVVSLTAVLGSTTPALPAPPQGYFTNVQNLGPIVNSSTADSGDSVDGLSFYVTSSRPGGVGGSDILQVTRNGTEHSFNVPVNLGTEVNSSVRELYGGISADGRALYFASERPGADEFDIYEATRATTAEPFGNVTNLTAVNSAQRELYPFISADGLALHFASNRTGGFGLYDLYKATRSTPQDPFGNVTNLGPPINTDSHETRPSLSTDGLTLFFSDHYSGGYRPGGEGGGDLWVTTRATSADPFATPVSLDAFGAGSDVNTPNLDVHPGLSAYWPAFGSKLYFTSNQDGGHGSWDVWQATWVTCEARGPVLYVDADARGNNQGTSWADAVPDLALALGIAASDCTSVDEIWVAGETYTPTGPGGAPSATFQLVSGVAVYGGFAGTETDRDQRNPNANITILSGDLNADDDAGGSNAENAYHVVTASGTDATAVLDGLVITGGNGNEGGGLYNDGGAPTVIGCRFVGNTAVNRGGAMYNRAGRPTLIDCAFSGNTQTSASFIGSLGGGAICNDGASPGIVNSTFHANIAAKNGGAIYNIGVSNPAITNSVLWSNTDSGGSDESAQVHGGSPSVTFSCIQGLATFAGSGNLGDDPHFADADGPDDVAGTLDDDLRLAAASSCIDAGNDAAVPADITTDLAGHPRIMGSAVDMGAHETFPPPVPALAGPALGVMTAVLAIFGSARLRRRDRTAPA